MPAARGVAAGADRGVFGALFPTAPDVGKDNRFQADESYWTLAEPLIGGDHRFVK